MTQPMATTGHPSPITPPIQTGISDGDWLVLYDHDSDTTWRRIYPDGECEQVTDGEPQP